VTSNALAQALRDWRPGTLELTRRVDPWSAEAFADLIGAPPPPPPPPTARAAVASLPPLWHWFTLVDHPAQSEIGADGHPMAGPLLPPIPRRRRMFAGGRLRLDAPIPLGAQLSSRSTVAAVSVKSGRSGEQAFVTIRHELAADGATVGVEEQDIVYRCAEEGAVPGQRPLPSTGFPEPAGDWRAELAADPSLLFRFSALTCNAHRIHYDLPYATGVEGYPGLVVHGPLLALLALELPRMHAPERVVRGFDYRLVRPAFAPVQLVSAGGPDGEAAEVAVAAQGAEPSLTGTIFFGTGK
jgi:3-methylfumaryl-CoA hydratase